MEFPRGEIDGIPRLQHDEIHQDRGEDADITGKGLRESDRPFVCGIDMRVLDDPVDHIRDDLDLNLFSHRQQGSKEFLKAL